MDTNDRPAVELTDSLLVEGSVIIARRNNGKLYAVEPYTREELQAIVQQAHDVYGVTADPFATPGSADVDGDPRPDHVGHAATEQPDPYLVAAGRPRGLR